jgi:hypothetical protein
MKKYLLFILIGLLGLTSLAQDLETANEDTHLSGFSGTSAANELSAHIDVINLTDTELEIECAREILLKEAPNSVERFCWGGLCFEENTDVSPLSLTMPAGYTALSVDPSGIVGNGLTAYYNYNGEDGVCQIDYCFREVGNPDNQACITVNFCVDVAGVCDTFLGTNEIIEKTVLGQASPNPASANFLISYKLGSEAVEAEMIIMNSLGQHVKNVQLASRTAVINFNAADLQTGMYFYTLKNNGKTEGTKKFMVSH